MARAAKALAKAAPQKPSGRLNKGARTKAQIKDAIAALINERGKNNLTLEDVCKRTGLTVGAFYFHFPSKEAAIEDVTIDFIRGFYGGMAEAPAQPTLHGEITQVIAASLKAVKDNPATFHLPYTVLPTSPAVYKVWLYARAALMERFAAAVARARGRPGEPDGQDHLAAQFLMAGLEGFLENAYFGADPLMGAVELDPAALTRDLAALWLSAITGEAAAAPTR